MSQYVTRIKIFFTAVVIVFASVMFIGSFALKDTHGSILSFSDVDRLTNSISYHFQFEKFVNGKGFLSSLFSLGTGSQSVSNNKNALAVPVFVYHGIVSNPDRFSMTPDTFKDQMFALKKAGYETISLADLVAFVKGKKMLPEKSFLLTFDDGRKDSYFGADPILKALGYSAVMFTVTDDSLPTDGKVSNYYLNESDLKEMIATGRWSIESHGKQESHNASVDAGYVLIDEKGDTGNFLSNRMWLPASARLETPTEYTNRVIDELAGSKQIFENELGIKVSAFAYPFGDYGQQTANFRGAEDIISSVVKTTYDASFHQIWPTDHEYSWNYVSDDLQRMRRIEPSPLWSGEFLLNAISNGKPKDPAYTDSFATNSGWKRSWGTIGISNGTLTTGASEQSTGSFVFLDGAKLWTNYLFNAVVDWQKGNNLSLVARFKNEFNYVDCSFSDFDVRIEEFENNVKTTHLIAKNNFVMPHQANLSILVNHNVVECFVNGNVVAATTGTDIGLEEGGVAFKTWDPKLSNTFVKVSHVSVTPIADDGTKEVSALSKTELTLLPPVEKPTGTTVVPPKGGTGTTVVETPVTPILLQDSFTINDFMTSPVWKAILGKASISSSGLQVSSADTGTESFVSLPGTEGWFNYIANVSLNWFKGRNFYVVTRMKDSKNYLMCSFSNYGNTATIYQAKNGSVKNLGGSPSLPIPYIEPWKNVSVGMSVEGTIAKCLVDGDPVISATIPSAPLQGGIALKGFDQAKGNSLFEVTNITVEEIKE